MEQNMSIDLYVDEAYLLALINDEPIPISDEKFAVELQLQEALSNSSSFPLLRPKTVDGEKQSKNPENRTFELGESSNSKFIFCGICMESKQIPEIFKGLTKCNHSFCIDCVVKYIASKIKEKIIPVECLDPKCNRVIEPEDCESVLPKEVFGRWENALFEASILGSQKFYCPFKDCSALMVDDGDEEVTQSECPYCRRMFCAQCRVRWHDGVTCREHEKLGKDEREREDIMLMKLAKDKQWSRCSECMFYVEKTEGYISSASIVLT
ncbi:hypothetical protein Cgig2_031141 [Carnegiea gigantea]|uniref:RBR-type E3 ubiquitin transferase n=1 Tax=Carnegiea gigantea TaxID=171969 RepID=A0A9Q1KRF8_9CARY|nr:hypothetical protein Cgig2_031141 [Carnegiea gigantea]